jgi:branched-chain amino acid transport system permease protein
MLLFLFIVYTISEFIVKSNFGRIIRAIRDDENILTVFGYNIFKFKVAIFIISAIMASITGSFFSSYMTFIDPSGFTITESMFLVIIVIFGGLANNRGVLVSSSILLILPELLRFIGLPNDMAALIRQALFGVVLIILMLYRPSGLMGRFKI